MLSSLTMKKKSELSLYSKILENLSDAVLLFDERFELVFINTAAEILLEGSARQFLGTYVTDLLHFDEISIEHDLKRCVDTGVAIAERNVVIGFGEYQRTTVNFIATPLFEALEATSVLVEMHQVDRHLRISREQQLLAQQTASRLLVRGLAHEIKNPLGGLRGAAQLLDQELVGNELREYTNIIIEESDRLRTLIDRLLGPNKPPQKKPVNIHKVLERVCQLVQAEVLGGISLERDYDPSIPLLYADNDQLIQALLNIVRNAAQAIKDKGKITVCTRICRQVTIGSRSNKLAVKIDVVDDGVGIKPEVMGQIFYPMVSGRAEGTGLGLPIAQSLINGHGGIVECTSTPGNTVFSIHLPLENGE